MKNLGFKPASTRRALLAVCLVIGLLAPGLAKADYVGYSCGAKVAGFGKVCVRAENDALISCYVLDGKPACYGVSFFGALAYSPTNSGGFVEVIANAIGGPDQLTKMGLLFIPVWRPSVPQHVRRSGTWKGYGIKEVPGVVLTPAANGPVGGCITYRMSVQVIAHAGTNRVIKTLPDGQTSTYSEHSHQVERFFCA